MMNMIHWIPVDAAFGLREGPLRGQPSLRRVCALAGGARDDGRDPGAAPGFSCRHQIADFCDNRRSLHTAELLAMAGGVLTAHRSGASNE